MISGKVGRIAGADKHLPLQAAIIAAMMAAACAPPGPRPHYSRDQGTWIDAQPPGYSWTTPSELGRPRGSETELRRVAESYLGVRYRWGGHDRDGMDCSGFVQRVFDEAHGMQLPRNSAAMARYGKKVDREDLQPGDLVFFKRTTRARSGW
jgi:cell wall-associated NlpC family hydrolase